MDNIKTYLQASYEELTTKVTWPTWKELQSNAAVVAIAALIIALIIGLMDMFSNIMFSDIIYKMTKQSCQLEYTKMSEEKKMVRTESNQWKGEKTSRYNREGNKAFRLV